MKALYNGYTKVPLLLGQCTTTYVVHSYNQKEGNFYFIFKHGTIYLENKVDPFQL